MRIEVPPTKEFERQHRGNLIRERVTMLGGGHERKYETVNQLRYRCRYDVLLEVAPNADDHSTALDTLLMAQRAFAMARRLDSGGQEKADGPPRHLAEMYAILLRMLPGWTLSNGLWLAVSIPQSEDIRKLKSRLEFEAIFWLGIAHTVASVMRPAREALDKRMESNQSA